MKYIYRNVTQQNQSVLLTNKDQSFVNTKVFTPGATLELDYPGLNLYVPNILHCIVIDAPESVISEETTEPTPEVKEVKAPKIKISEVKKPFKKPGKN